MVSRLSLLLFCGIIGAHLGDAQKLPKVKKLNMKAYINVTGDTLIMRFHRPNQNIKLEGFILGYGSNYFSNQYIQWPDNGKSYITDVDAETRYLIAVKPNDNPKKSCKEKNSFQKPLQLVIGTLSPTSVFLSWGILINPQVDWSALNKCPNDRFYTVRYREKNKDWLFQLCPTTETVIENLKPNTVYEFGVKDNSEDEIWSKPQTHKTSPKGKENGNIENNYKIPKGTLQYATEDTKAFVPVTKVKQGFHNLTKSTPPPTGKSPVYRGEIKKPYVATTTTRIATPKPKPVTKSTEAPPVSKPSEKPAVEHPKPATTRQIIPAVQSNLPSPTRTQATTGKLAFTEVQHSPTLYGSIARTEGPYSVSVLTGGQHIPTSYESIARTEAPQSVSATSVQQRTRPPRTQTKTTKVFTGGQHIPSTYESIARTEAPQFVSATATQMSPVQQRTRSTRTQIKTTTAFTGRQHIPSTYESITRTEAPHSVSVTTTQMSPIQQRTRPPRTQTTATMGGQHVYTTHESIARTEAPHSVSAVTTQIIPAKQRTLPSHPRTKVTTVPNETASFHPKPLPSTEGQNAEADSKQPGSEISRTEAPHAYEEENVTLASQDKTVVQKFSSTSKPKTTTVHKTTSRPFTTISSTTSQWTQSTQASKKATVSPVQHKTPLPKKTHPTAVLKDIDPTQLLEETTTTMAQTKTQKLIPKKAHTTELPSFPVDPRTTHSLPTDDLGYDIFEHSKIPLEANKTEKASSPKFNRTTKSPTISTVIKPVHTKKMPINLISLQIFADPTLPSEKTETQTISPPIPKTTQSNKILYSKPAPKSTQRVPINFISLQIFEEPDAPLVPNTTQRLYQPTTTQKPESPPQTKPVPTQKVSSQTTKKPKPTRRTKPASTGAPKETAKPKQPHVIHATTLAPYRLQHNSSRPKTSLRPRTRPPATNGTTQGPVRSRPNGEFNWQPGTIPGGRVHDTTTRILGATRNTSMESNNTGKRTFSVSSPPLPPVRPTYIRRRIQPSNVTGRPGVSVSSPPHLPVKPTTIRRKPPSANETGRPGNQGGILIPRASSATKPECAVACIKSPTKQPTLPAQEEDLVYSTVFSPSPKSDIDALGKTRYTAPHVVYMSKNDSVPCSITDTLQHFSTEEENLNQEITSAPQNPPTNLTVVTVEGCSSFVVIQWDKPNNDTVTEYNLISKENGGVPGKDESIITTNQTHSTVENLKPDTSYEFKVIPINPLGEGPGSATVGFNTESADPRVSEPVTGGKDAIWTEIKFKADSYSECRGKQYVKRTWYKKFVGIQLCNSLRYKIYLSDTLSGTFYNIGDQSGFGEDHCQFVDSFLEGRTGQQLQPNELEPKKGFYRAVRQQPVDFGDIGGSSHISYVHWYECGKSIPGKW
ncbi:target of Nesh-SH3 isoform X20 [Hyla sarda]|uniref:target of Nesh-SH3 isoform X20 n=1 Tax=Hyla sarda TaxID=327740 RepID=UPI0024C2DF21|nr:target of Nesh-SH3 isoform X20 [Hyla sarda]